METNPSEHAILPRSVMIILLTFAGFALPFALRYGQMQLPRNPLPPPASRYTGHVPEKAVRGTFTDVTGDVRIMKREATQSAAIRADDTFLPGESVTAPLGSGAAWRLSDKTTVEIDALSEAVYIHGIEPHILLQLRSGNMTVTTSAAVSVRAGSVLAEISGGTAYVTNKSGLVTVHVGTGSATIAYIDLDNTTRAWQLGANTYASIHDQLRTIQTNGILLDKAE